MDIFIYHHGHPQTKIQEGTRYPMKSNHSPINVNVFNEISSKFCQLDTSIFPKKDRK